MTEREMIATRIDFLKKTRSLLISQTCFEIKALEEQMESLTTTTEMPRQKPRATNFDYKNEV